VRTDGKEKEKLIKKPSEKERKSERGALRRRIDKWNKKKWYKRYRIESPWQRLQGKKTWPKGGETMFKEAAKKAYDHFHGTPAKEELRGEAGVRMSN